MKIGLVLFLFDCGIIFYMIFSTRFNRWADIWAEKAGCAIVVPVGSILLCQAILAILILEVTNG
ncbi:MAG: hypothetical protein KAV87_19460 [Desulfobacteraceae bacterium]|nr:hypothetical protein [Desulfobacteraceae bacterium]